MEEKRIFDSKLKVSLAEKQKYVCPLCGNKMISLEDRDIDHILPYSLGGTTDESNAQLVHHHCNLNKSSHINLDEVLSSLGTPNAYVLRDENTSLTGKKCHYKVICFYFFLGLITNFLQGCPCGGIHFGLPAFFGSVKDSRSGISRASQRRLPKTAIVFPFFVT